MTPFSTSPTDQPIGQSHYIVCLGLEAHLGSRGLRLWDSVHHCQSNSGTGLYNWLLTSGTWGQRDLWESGTKRAHQSCELRMSFWMVLTQCARQGGVIAGPAVFALVSVIVSQGGRTQLAPCSLMAWAIFAQVIFGHLELGVCLCVFEGLRRFVTEREQHCHCPQYDHLQCLGSRHVIALVPTMSELEIEDVQRRGLGPRVPARSSCILTRQPKPLKGNTEVVGAL